MCHLQDEAKLNSDAFFLINYGFAAILLIFLGWGQVCLSSLTLTFEASCISEGTVVSPSGPSFQCKCVFLFRGEDMVKNLPGVLLFMP